MTEQTPDREAIDTAQALTGVLGGMRDELKAFNDRQDRAEERQAAAEKKQRRDRLLIIITVVSLIIDLTLTGLFIANNVKLDHTTMALQHTQVTLGELHQTQVSGCVAGNVTRAKEIALWNHLAGLSRPSPGETKKQIATNKRAVDGFLRYVAKTFAPRNCQALYRIDH